MTPRLRETDKKNTKSHKQGLIVYMKYLLVLFILFYTGYVSCQPGSAEIKMNEGVVVLLHGLARSSSSMNKIQKELEKDGFKTCNIDYPSRHHNISTLAHKHLLPKIKTCTGSIHAPIHFVTHSMGGILVRYLARHALISHIGRVVMLSPPNKGSEVVDTLGKTWFFKLINGPAGKELGTDRRSMPLQLEAADFEVGIITGSKSINFILSLMIEGRDDGKVSIENAKLEGMQDFLVLPASHPFIMKNKTVIEQTIYFLHHGVFKKNEAED